MTVPPGTLASASSLTFAAVSPLSSVSSLRWWPHGLCPLGATDDGLEPELEPDPLAAEAIP
jgi:hypothetical protein